MSSAKECVFEMGKRSQGAAPFWSSTRDTSVSSERLAWLLDPDRSHLSQHLCNEYFT